MRLLLPVGATLLLAMLVAWAIALTMLTRVMQDQLDAKLLNATGTLAAGGLPYTAELLQRLDRLIGARVVLLDASGDAGLTTADARLTGIIEDAGLAADAVSAVTIDTGGETYRAAVQPVPGTHDARYRYVVAAASLEESRSVVKGAAALLATAMLVATALLSVFISFFIRGITRPVADLATMANRIAAGERHIESDIDGDNEIGVLTRSFNDMAAKIDEYEQELAQKSRLAGLGDLASRMAHEIRNPLTAMKMQLEMLEEHTTDENRPRVIKVLNEVRRLEVVVDNALALAGANAINPAPTDLAALIEDTAELLQPSLAHRQIELRWESPTLPHVAIDPHRIRQVLLNLINNAADELNGGGTILVSSSIDGEEYIDVLVEDSGPGIAESPNTSKKPLGLGLGLQISQEIVEGHGGELLRDRSERLGGARFTLHFPVTIMSNHAS